MGRRGTRKLDSSSTDAGGGAGAPHITEASAYEVERNLNIAANKRKLALLGLDTKHAHTAPTKSKASTRPPRCSKRVEPAVGERSSKRLRTQTPASAGLPMDSYSDRPTPTVAVARGTPDWAREFFARGVAATVQGKKQARRGKSCCWYVHWPVSCCSPDAPFSCVTCVLRQLQASVDPTVRSRVDVQDGF